MATVSPGSRIALTGATGFVGKHLLQLLVDTGYRVSALTRRDPTLQHNNVDWVRGDLDDKPALQSLVRNADAVVHVAGLIKARRKQDFFNVNVRGTWSVLEALQQSDRPTRFIHISSLAAREPGLSHYAASKAEAEAAIKASPAATDWTILRAPGIYGPGDEETLFFFQTAMSRLPILPGSRSARTSLVHVHDFNRAILTALESPALIGRTADVHDDAPNGYLLKDVLALINSEAANPVHIPGLLLRALGGANLVIGRALNRTPSLTPGKARELTHPDWVCRDRTLVECTDWTPWIKAERGLPETRDWYRLHGYLK
ncbi:MAG: NAD-dependent epimerase/dehydratase family protein [Alphaproteobacteria bacterium]